MCIRDSSEIVDGGFFTQHSSDWRGKGVEITYSGAASASAEGATVTVPASGEATVGIDVAPGSEFASYVAENTPNGTFLDGFVRFASRTASQPDLLSLIHICSSPAARAAFSSS